MSYNTSTATEKYYFEVAWGAAKKIYIDRFSFGDEFAYAELIVENKHFVRNPVFIYPVVRGMQSNPLVRVLEEFHSSNGLLPRCSIGVELIEDRQPRRITMYQFLTVKVLEIYGGGGDRRVGFYKLQYNSWKST